MEFIEIVDSYAHCQVVEFGKRYRLLMDDSAVPSVTVLSVGRK